MTSQRRTQPVGAAAAGTRASVDQGADETQEPGDAEALQHKHDEQVQAAKNTLDSIADQFVQLNELIRGQVEAFKTKTANVAIRIAKEAVGSDETLVEQRVTHFANILTHQIPNQQNVTLFVHPSCLERINQWAAELGRDELVIQADGTVQPGDCRIEINENGLLASIDAYLEAAANRYLSQGQSLSQGQAKDSHLAKDRVSEMLTEPLRTDEWVRTTGRLQSVEGRMCATLDAAVGELVEIKSSSNRPLLAEVIGFTDDKAQLMPYQSGVSFQRGDVVISTGRRMRIPVGTELLGRIIDALGRPIDGRGPIHAQFTTDFHFDSPDPLTRPLIRDPFTTGVRTIDGLLTLGQGQRVGLFAGSGVGKSTLLGEIAKFAVCDVNVVAMIGERGREVRPFIEDTLGAEGLARSVVIVSTSDQPPLSRVRASESAVAIASWFRSQGLNVLFMLDSLTRLAHAQRELGLLLGEPPTSRGYTPSVFQKMAQLLEQLGTSDEGVITGLLTILVDGDDMNEPVADAARAILDGHIVLDRKLAHQNHFPAINVLKSASRLFNEVTSVDHQQHAATIRRMLAKYAEVEDLIQIGAYQKGMMPDSDRAIETLEDVNRFLRQPMNAPSSNQETHDALHQLHQLIGGPQ